jgi:hypothetical protein
MKNESNKPKAPTSSFLMFFHDHKKKISEKYQETNISKLTKLASQCWKELPTLEKDAYL